MNNELKAFLFSKALLVSEKQGESPFETLVLLANQFEIKIVQGQEYADESLVPFVAQMMGRDVPQSFYYGFPQSVRDLTADQKLFDQLLHYAITYGMGYFSEAGHSLFEENFHRLAFCENVEPKKFAILTEEQAETKLAELVEDMLNSARPLSPLQQNIVNIFVQTYNYKVQNCACKDTAMHMLLEFDDIHYARFFSLADVVKFVETLNYRRYQNENIKKLNLKNKDRKLISRVLDWILQNGQCNIADCFEKKAVWCGLLHHIHYKPNSATGEAFVSLMRGKGNLSVYAQFERAMRNRDILQAAEILKQGKGSGALLRNLNYILSRCSTQQEMDAVLSSLNVNKPILLIQLLMQYSNYVREGSRTFTFSRFNKLKIHTETEEESASRKSTLSEETVSMVECVVRKRLQELLHGRLGKVYVSPEMHKVALPLQESTSNGGYGVLPKGSRIALPKNKKLRAFTYWERVNDIDLSAIGLSDEGVQCEFSWRTMALMDQKSVVFSGDQTSGYYGGSEFFDVDIELFKKEFPKVKYLVFCNNVYSELTFDKCVCRAGFMARDIEDSGEIFEAKTVKSSFTVNCQSSFAYLFGLDLQTNEFVWLNACRSGHVRVAGKTSIASLAQYFNATSVISLGSLFEMMATEVVSNAEDADVVVSDEASAPNVVHSFDVEKVLALLG